MTRRLVCLALALLFAWLPPPVLAAVAAQPCPMQAARPPASETDHAHHAGSHDAAPASAIPSSGAQDDTACAACPACPACAGLPRTMAARGKPGAVPPAPRPDRLPPGIVVAPLLRPPIAAAA